MGDVLILTYWSYSDALIQTYTLPYVAMIRNAIPAEKNIYLITLEKSADIDKRRIAHSLQQRNIIGVPLRYYPFGPKALIFWMITGAKLVWMIIRKRISFIHCWGTPAGAIGYFLSRLTGRSLVLDSYEPHAEAMVENGTWMKTGVAFRLLFWLEKKQTKRASHIIAATEGMRDYAHEKYEVLIKKFYVKPAGVDLHHFNLQNIKRPDIMTALGLSPEDVVCVYAGKFGGIYLGQEVFDLFAVAARYWGKKFKVVLLTNSPIEEINRYCEHSQLDQQIVVRAFVPHHEIPAYMGVADFAITPVKPVPSKRYCTPIKDGEYWALGLPVVIPANISDDSSIIEEHNIGAILHELNEAAYIEAVKKIDTLIKNPDIKTSIRNVASRYRSFVRAENIYREIYGS